MGVKLASLVRSRTQTLSSLAGQRLAVDGTYTIIAGLKKIRPKGLSFTNRWGEPLAPIHTIFYKALRLLEEGVRPVFVFDGIPPSEKRIRDQKHLGYLQKLWCEYVRAREAGEVQRVKSLFQSSALIYRKALIDVLEILKSMGVPAMIAPSEGEAQGSYLVKAGHSQALLTSDYDSLLFGCPRVVNRLDLEAQQMSMIHLDDVLRTLEVTYPQLVDIGILVGTDFHPGVPGIGPKRALKLILKFTRIEAITGISPPNRLAQLRALFLTPVVTPYNPMFQPPNVEMCGSLLALKGFGSKRVEKACLRLERAFRRISTVQQLLS